MNARRCGACALAMTVIFLAACLYGNADRQAASAVRLGMSVEELEALVEYRVASCPTSEVERYRGLSLGGADAARLEETKACLWSRTEAIAVLSSAPGRRTECLVEYGDTIVGVRGSRVVWFVRYWGDGRLVTDETCGMDALHD